MERGRIQGVQGLPQFFEYSLLSQEWVVLKLQTSNFVCTFIRSIETKDH